MLIVHNDRHHLHRGRFEMYRGHLVESVETPDRLDHVAAELARRGRTGWHNAEEPERRILERVHDRAYLDFLAHAWEDWVALDPANAAHDVLPSIWPAGASGLRQDVVPANFAARLGRYCFDAGTPLMAGTWEAARLGAGAAIACARHVGQGKGAAFTMTRPPGHHAGRACFGGYCFLNNAALAVETLIDCGAARVAVLDIDYHHGNGTQDIFYDRADVLTVSIHGDPASEYPFYSGYGDETGRGAGEGFNLNLPLPPGATAYAEWRQALDRALAAIARFGANALVVASGLDTFKGDPIARFALESEDYLKIGAAIAGAGLPTLFTLEGGYAVAPIGVNLANLLDGFEDLAG